MIWDGDGANKPSIWTFGSKKQWNNRSRGFFLRQLCPIRGSVRCYARLVCSFGCIPFKLWFLNPEASGVCVTETMQTVGAVWSVYDGCTVHLATAWQQCSGLFPTLTTWSVHSEVDGTILPLNVSYGSQMELLSSPTIWKIHSWNYSPNQ